MPESSFGPAAELIVATLSVTVVFFALDLWRRVAEAAQTQGVRASSAILLGAWLGLAFVATYTPAVGAVIVSVPGLFPVLLLSIIAILLWAGFRPAFRRALDAIAPESMMSFFYWRAIFGALLLASYAAGRLPAGFAVPAGLGDMAVTMLAVVLLTLKDSHGGLPRGPLGVWNALGLLDLVVSVLFLGTTVLRPWAAQRGIVGGNFSMQLFVVPIFIAAHMHIFARLWRRGSESLRVETF
jgi:hypothetical protein